MVWIFDESVLDPLRDKNNNEETKENKDDATCYTVGETTLHIKTWKSKCKVLFTLQKLLKNSLDDVEAHLLLIIQARVYKCYLHVFTKQKTRKNE